MRLFLGVGLFLAVAGKVRAEDECFLRSQLSNGKEWCAERSTNRGSFNMVRLRPCDYDGENNSNQLWLFEESSGLIRSVTDTEECLIVGFGGDFDDSARMRVASCDTRTDFNTFMFVDNMIQIEGDNADDYNQYAMANRGDDPNNGDPIIMKTMEDTSAFKWDFVEEEPATPTEAPTDAPTEAPTDEPTIAPTPAPTPDIEYQYVVSLAGEIDENWCVELRDLVKFKRLRLAECDSNGPAKQLWRFDDDGMWHSAADDDWCVTVDHGQDENIENGAYLRIIPCDEAGVESGAMTFEFQNEEFISPTGFYDEWCTTYGGRNPNVGDVILLRECGDDDRFKFTLE